MKKNARWTKGERLQSTLPTKALHSSRKSIKLGEGGEEVHAIDLGRTPEEWRFPVCRLILIYLPSFQVLSMLEMN